MTGLFIAFEGGEGVGKSTQVKLLAARLRAAGHDVLVTREPGGTPEGGVIRGMLLDPAARWSARAEALLYAADRAQHVDHMIGPALRHGATVICDRYVDSSIAYQAAGRNLDPREVARLSAWASGGLVPDVTVVLDLDPAAGLARAARRSTPDRLESETHGFHERVRAAFLGLAAAEPYRYVVVDAASPIDGVAAVVSGGLDRTMAYRADHRWRSAP